MWENEELVFNGYQVSVGEDEKLLEMDSDDGWKTMWMFLMSQKCTLKNG